MLISAGTKDAMELWKRTPMNDTLFGNVVEVMDGFEYLSNGPNGIPLSELALLADAVKELATGSQLGDDIELVLQIRC